MLTASDIEKVYGELREAMTHYANQAENLIAAKQDLEFKKLRALANGLIVGKNADERESVAQQLFADEYLAVADIELTERGARLRLDLVGVDVASMRAQLRLAEVLARAEQGPDDNL